MAKNASELFRHFEIYNGDGISTATIPIMSAFTTAPHFPTSNSSGVTASCGIDDGEDTTTMLYAIIGLLLFNIFLHTSGCTLLYQTLNKTKGYVQQLFILNLSLSELFKNIFKLIRYVAKLILEKGSVGSVSSEWCSIAAKLKPYCKYIHVWGIYPLYFFMMVFLTVDRLLATILTLSYKIYITETKAKCLLISTWLIIGGLAIGMNIAYSVNGFVVQDPLPAYIYGVLHILYALLAVFTYTIMFYKFAQSQRLHGSRMKNGTKGFQMSFKRQYSTAFKESRFFVCILIITSFCVLSIIPGLLFIPMIKMGVHIKFPHLKLLVHLCYMLSDTVDASIYIFLQRSIRKLLAAKFCCFRCGDTDNDSFFGRKRLQTDSTTTRETVEMLKDENTDV